MFVFRLKQLTVDDVHMASLCFGCAINSDLSKIVILLGAMDFG